MKNKFLILIFFKVGLLSAQFGTLTGKLTDNVFQDPVPFANILVKGTQKGAASDFDGNYIIELDPGIYTVIFSYIGYQTQEISNILIKEGKTFEMDIILKEISQDLGAVVVTTTAKKNTETAVLAFQKKSTSLLDGLSAQRIKKAGSGNIASAILRVPGVSVQNGKYIYVRGLGDRYTKSILNGMDVPGLDPDRNSLPMDIFPTGILENLIVTKSLTADNPADFTGGIVNIVTKEFPSEKEFNLSISTSYNPDMHFKNNYFNFQGGSRDFLGADDGKRALPTDPYTSYDLAQIIPSVATNSILETETKKFDPNMAATIARSALNYRGTVSYGNQHNIGKEGIKKVGYFFSGNYSSMSSLYENAENNQYIKKINRDSLELRISNTQKGLLGSKEVIASVMGGISYKDTSSKYKFNTLYIQNGQATAGEFIQLERDTNQEDFKKSNLEWTERSIANFLFSGTHTNKDASLKAEWKFSPTFSKIFDKDVRNTQYVIVYDDNGNAISYNYEPNTRPTRIWRELQEKNYIGKADITKKFNLFLNSAKLKIGGLYSLKEREFDIFRYFVQIGNGFLDTTGDPNVILKPENIWRGDNLDGNYILFNSSDVVERGTAYVSQQKNSAGYVSLEFKIIAQLKAVLGLRYEDFKIFYKGVNSSGQIYTGKSDAMNVPIYETVSVNFNTLPYNNPTLRPELLDYQNIIDVQNIFPSANFIYELAENKNLRLSYSKSTARPSFKEASIAQIYDPLSNITFIGNININPTYIDNFDIRFEVFGTGNELFALSAFYKNFKDPIELATFETDADNFQPRNLGNAEVLGAEIEIRTKLGFLIDEKLSLKINATYISSRQAIGAVEANLRESSKRNGETVAKTRPLQGQSPYLINGGLEYNDIEKGIESSLFYNVQGKTLEVVGLGEVPDVFTMPFHSLNFVFRKKIGKEQNQTLNFRVLNILDDKRESVFQSFGATDKLFRFRNIGRTFSFGYGVTF